MSSEPATRYAGIPAGIRAILQALRVDQPDVDSIGTIAASEWPRILDWCDRNQLTIPLARTCLDAFPSDVRARLRQNLASNNERNRRVRAIADRIGSRLNDAGLEYILLKGLTQAPEFVPDIDWRAQYDLDLYLPSPAVYNARDVLLDEGYEPARGYDHLPTDHLPVMVQRSGWTWRNDYFDPDLPPSIDLHFRFWDAATESFSVDGTELFWGRRIKRSGWPALCLQDAVAYSALHLIRHLLRGSVKPFHVYELALLLKARVHDDAFWQTWRELHPPGLRNVQAIAFQLAQCWFGCPDPAGETLAPPIHDWFRSYNWSPIAAQFKPNKDELWLHLHLIESAGDRLRVLRRRVFPTRFPGLGAHGQTAGNYMARMFSRARYHAAVIPSVTWHAGLWYARAAGVNGSLLRLLAATALFNLGNFVFFVLYNLHLLRIGFREDFIGAVTTAMTVGSIAGTLPGGWLAQRLELRIALPSCAAALAILFLIRTMAADRITLLGAAAAHGFVFSCWAVMIVPSVARLTTERTRAAGYSVFMSCGIATGIIGGVVAGWLPEVITRWSPNVDGSAAALCLSSALVAMSIPALLRLPPLGVKASESRRYPSGGFLVRFLIAVAVWNFGTGLFNPFFNAYFARQLNASTAFIGSMFSAGQISQIVALLITPILLRSMSFPRTIAIGQVIAGVALVALAGMMSLPGAAALYIVYMSAQYASEPRMLTLLMGRLTPQEQGGASALNFLAAFLSEALAAFVAGLALSRFGYPPVLIAAGSIAVLAALLFVRLDGRTSNHVDNASLESR